MIGSRAARRKTFRHARYTGVARRCIDFFDRLARGEPPRDGVLSSTTPDHENLHTDFHDSSRASIP